MSRKRTVKPPESVPTTLEICGEAALNAIHQLVHPDDSFFAPPAALVLATRCL